MPHYTQTVVFIREIRVEIDPRSGKVYYIKERKIACIELPDGRWLAVKSRRNDDEKLLGELKSLYGEIEYGPGGSWTR